MAMGRRAAAVAAAAAALASVAAPATAQPLSLRDHLFGPPTDERAFSIPTIGRFQPERGAAFVLDRSAGRQVLLKFESRSEIWALDPTPGPRGDVIYKNDMGEPVLRATRLGGLTLFTPQAPGGVAAAFTGQAQLLRPSPVGTPAGLLQSFTQASERAARVVQHPVAFEADNVPIAAIAIFADTAAVAAEAFVEVASRGGPRGARVLARYTKVRIGLGETPLASVAGETVQIFVDPDRGVAGRPSSQRIAAAMSAR